MSRAIAGDPRKDKKFDELSKAMQASINHFAKLCYDDDPKTGKNIIHNLDQKRARSGFARCSHMISHLTRLQGDLLVRMDICNEQARPHQPKSSKNGQKSKQLDLLDGEI